MAGRQCGHGVDRAFDVIARLEGINRCGIHQLAGGINHCNLDPGTYTRIKTHGGLLPGRGRQQQVFQVIGKDLDRAFLGGIAQRAKQIKLNRQRQFDSPGPAHRVH